MSFPITATFIDEITYDIPSSNWSNEQWSRDLDYMQSVGIDTLVFIRAGYGNRTIFPSEYFGTMHEDDLLGFILKEAEKRNMSVLVGGYLSTLSWNNGDAKNEIELNRHFINEIWTKCKSKLKDIVLSVHYATYIDTLKLIEIIGDTAHFTVPYEFCINILETKYYNDIKNIMKKKDKRLLIYSIVLI